MTLTFSESMAATSTETCNQQSPREINNNRCYANGCRKKLKLTDMECRCNKTFCAAHRLPETHACTFDHNAREWSALVNQLMSCQTESNKVQAI